MTANANAVTLRALRELFVVQAEQAPDASYQTLVREVLGECHAELLANEIIGWTIDDCPDEAIGPFARYVAAMAAPRVVGPDEEILKRQSAQAAYRALVAVSAKKWNGMPNAAARY